MFAERRSGVSLRCAVEGPAYEGATNGCVHTIDSSAILDGDRLHVFLTNRSVNESAEVEIKLAGGRCAPVKAPSCSPARMPSGQYLRRRSIVKAQPFKEIRVADGQAVCQLPPLSFAAITLKLT